MGKIGKNMSLEERFTIEGLEEYHKNLEERVKNHSLHFHKFPQAFEKIAHLGDENSDVKVVGVKIPQSNERGDDEMTEPNVPTMITVDEAAKLTGLPAYLIRKLCYEGKVVHLRVGDKGTKVFVNRDRLIDYLNSNTGRTEKRKDNDYER